MSKNDVDFALSDSSWSCSDLQTNIIKLEPKVTKRKKRVPCSKFMKKIETLQEIEEKCQSYFHRHLDNIWQNLILTERHAALLYQAAQTLSERISSSFFFVYLVEDDKLVNYQKTLDGNIVRGEEEEINKLSLAGSVAEKKMSLLIEDTENYRGYLESLDFKVDEIKSIICVPICDPTEVCLAVLEFFRIGVSTPFTSEDRAYIVANAGWIGAAIHQSVYNQEILEQERMKSKLMNYTQKYFSGERMAIETLQNMGITLKSTITANKLTIYAIDKSWGEPLVWIYREGYCVDHTELVRKNLPMTMDEIPKIFTIVINTGEKVVVTSSTDPRFGDHDRHKFGTYVRNLVLHPTKTHKGHVQGIIALLNKDVKGLTPKEEIFLDIIGDYCSLCCIHWQYEIRILKQKWSIIELKTLLNHNLAPCHHETKLYIENLKTFSVPEGFDSLTWYIHPEEVDSIPQLVYYMMDDLMGSELLSKECLAQYILKVRSAYRQVTFHNFQHAFNAAHCMYTIIKRNMNVFTEMEKKGLFLGALCHDADHPGLSNNFLMLIKSRTVLLYDGESPLENHHYYVTMAILQETKIFKNLDEKSYRDMALEIRKTIISTDLAVHFRLRNESFQLMFENFNFSEIKHRDYLKCYVTTACDLSGNSKSFSVVKKLTDNLLQEFYHEGDTQKSMNVKPLSLMDREQYDYVPKDQVLFLEVVVLPCLEVLAEVLPNTEELLRQTLKVRQKWIVIRDRGIEYWRYISRRPGGSMEARDTEPISTPEPH
ncbi:cAMP and cAMP-inhibited cGMP 3',5'-cyclic phosphodiesterase 10A-like [Agrilus planipennis]|uniref:3',5'-cyclic-GMP phosphodiesterase n=1 Tax=Agrilus planipennis TaxID=224129 RepID=A0A1W4X008_AGRPL|nr:cAMP and cAMP-inhibited cGMP 3',5'-cyclic phosphodiesterase 10A-like [Agrilus planipennis]